MKLNFSHTNNIFTMFMVRFLAVLIIMGSCFNAKALTNQYFQQAEAEKAQAVSFNEVFQTFGEVLPSYKIIKEWAGTELGETPGTTPTFKYQSHKGKEAIRSQQKVSNKHLSVAKAIYESFGPSESGDSNTFWTNFTTLAGCNGDSITSSNVVTTTKVWVDYDSHQVTRAKGVANADYKELKAYYAEINSGASTGDFVFDTLDSDKLTMDGGEMGETFMDGFYKAINPILYVIMNLTVIWFLVVTATDILFLLTPPFRSFVLALDNEKEKQTSSKGKNMVKGLISETAYNCVGYHYNKKDHSFEYVSAEGEKSANMDEPDYGYYVLHRSAVFIFLMVYLVLLISGILPTIVSGVAKAVEAGVDMFFNAF